MENIPERRYDILVLRGNFSLRLLKQLFSTVTMVGVPKLNAPAVQCDRVDRSSALNRQVNRVAQFVLSTVIDGGRGSAPL